MDAQSNEGRIDYIEFAATDMARTKDFYTGLFGWKFTDYGPDYTSFGDGRIAGGFYRSETVKRGGPMVVMYTADLEGMNAKVLGGGGTVTREIFAFPGGRRFHFTDPSGNELAIWSEK